MASTKSPELQKQSPSVGGRGADKKSMLLNFFVESLKDIYWAEKQLLVALPKLKEAATTVELKQAIQEHITQTEGHVKRLVRVFELCGIKAQAKKCEAMEGLVKESDSILQETEAGSITRDAAIIFAAQKVEHYEIATYGGLFQFAKTLSMSEAAGLLNLTLDEEKQTNWGLTILAESGINWEAEEEDVKKVSRSATNN